MDKASPKKTFDMRKLAARIYSAFIWHRDARRAFRNALINDYDLQIRELRQQIRELRDAQTALETRQSGFDVQISNLQTCAPRKKEDLPSPYRIEGKNNRIIVVEEDGRERLLDKNERIPGLEIYIHGDENEVKIHRPSTLWQSKIQIGQNGFKNNFASVEIGKGVTFSCVFLRINAGERQCFRFGDKSRIWGGEIILDETSGCLIGKDVNCSNHIYIWGSDAHAILDKNNPEKILNEVTGPITVGDHTWIGQGVRLQKNARIPPNSIIAAGSIVTKAFEEEYTILAGVPAKVVKRGVMREPKTQSAWHLKQQRMRSR